MSFRTIRLLLSFLGGPLGPGSMGYKPLGEARRKIVRCLGYDCVMGCSLHLWLGEPY